MIFTREDILKILNALLQLGRKDSEFKDASTPLNSNDEITILQDGINKKVSINNLLSTLGLLKKDDFINVSDRYDEYYIQLSEAITIIANNKRKKGLVITFLDLHGDWKIFQFNGELNNFSNIDYWKDLFNYELFIANSILPDEEDLTLTLPNERGNSFIKLKDKEYDTTNFSGMGTKIIRKNVIEITLDDGTIKRINYLSQDAFNSENTIYIIKYDFILSEDITIPANCVLEFDGGSVSNGKLISNDLRIVAKNSGIFTNITFGGSCIANTICELDWFIKQYPESDNDYSIDNTNEVKACFASGFKNIKFPNKYIHLTDTITVHKVINILTEEEKTNCNWQYHPTDKKNSRPCIFSKNVVTLFDYQIDSKYDDSDYIYTSSLYIGHIKCFIKKQFDNVDDINVPVINITPITELWGVTIDADITAVRCYFSIDEHTGLYFNYTGIKIATSQSTQYCSCVRINGNLVGLNYGVYLHGEAHNTSGWFTDVIIKSDTQCCQGGIFDNVSPVTIYGNHQSSNFSHEQIESEGYFVGNEIKLYGYVWDCGNLDAQSGFKTAILPVKLTKSVENSFILQPFDTRYRYDYYPNNFVRILNPINDYKFSFQNALYRALKPRNSTYWFIYPLSYTIQDDENSSPVSILTNYPNLINGDNLFNDKQIAESDNGYREFKNECYLNDCANKIIKLSFTILNTRMNAVFGEGGVPSVLLWQCYNSGVSVKVKVSYQDNGDTIVWYNYDNMASYYSGRLNVVKLPKVETINVEFELTTQAHTLILPSIIVPFYGSIDNNCVSSSIFSLPNLNAQERYGVQCYDLTTKKLNIWDGNKWYDALGIKNGVSTYGTFASKPTVSVDEIPIGFKYFCTDRQTTEGATNGIEIIHKGNDVWIDALGRVVS